MYSIKKSVANAERAIFTQKDRLRAAFLIVADAIGQMRREVPGITTAEIAGSLEAALEGTRGAVATETLTRGRTKRQGRRF